MCRYFWAVGGGLCLILLNHLLLSLSLSLSLSLLISIFISWVYLKVSFFCSLVLAPLSLMKLSWERRKRNSLENRGGGTGRCQDLQFSLSGGDRRREEEAEEEEGKKNINKKYCS